MSIHPAHNLHHARHKRNQRILDAALYGAQLRKTGFDAGRRLLEFHDQVLDHRHLEPGVAGEAEPALTNLPQRGATLLIYGKELGPGGGSGQSRM